MGCRVVRTRGQGGDEGLVIPVDPAVGLSADGVALARRELGSGEGTLRRADTEANPLFERIQRFDGRPAWQRHGVLFPAGVNDREQRRDGRRGKVDITIVADDQSMTSAYVRRLATSKVSCRHDV